MSQLVQLGRVTVAVQKLPAVAKPVPAPVHRIVCVDISGSMYHDLAELRRHLKNRLATLMGPNDTITIVWFSGRGQFGTLIEGARVHDASDLAKLNAAIDRFLQPMGLTGFKEPLQEVETLVKRLKAKGPAGALTDLTFLTDGYDNQWSDREILDLCVRLEKLFDGAAVIEYGYNCNRPLMTKMAAALGGKLIFSESFEAYRAAFEDILSGGGAKKVPVKLDSPLSGVVFALVGTNLLTFTPDGDGTVWVPEGLDTLAYITPLAGEAYDRTRHTDAHLWASLVPLARALDTDAVFSVLGALGDVALVSTMSSCFSKEDYNRFQDQVLAAAADSAKRYAEGYDAHAVPKEDAFTVLEMLGDLTADDSNLFYPYHDAFSYERTGAASVARDDKVKFEIGDKAKGYPISALVYNEDRPNVSIQVRIDGTVKLPADRPTPLPEVLPTFIYRAFTVIRDGIVHTRRLPVSLAKATFDKLQANGLLAGETWEAGKVFVLDFPKVPVINRRMVTGTTAKETFSMVLDLAALKATQKVFNDYRDREAPKESKKFLLVFGEAATAYLKELGITDYSGFNPPSDKVKSGDFYMAKELKIAVKGLSSLPKVSEAEASLAAGKKLKLGEALMAPAIKRIQDFMASPVYTSSADKKALLTTWLESESRAATLRTRELMRELAQRKFSVVVGQRWFTDLPSLDVNSLEIEVAGFGKVPVTATPRDVQIEL